MRLIESSYQEFASLVRIKNSCNQTFLDVLVCSESRVVKRFQLSESNFKRFQCRIISSTLMHMVATLVSSTISFVSALTAHFTILVSHELIGACCVLHNYNKFSQEKDMAKNKQDLPRPVSTTSATATAAGAAEPAQNATTAADQ